MPREFTFCREIDDLYNPDPDALIEVEIAVQYQYRAADSDVGIMCAGAEDICVISTDCALFDANDAQRWLDGGGKEADHVIERIHEAAREDEGPDPDDWYDRMRDERAFA